MSSVITTPYELPNPDFMNAIHKRDYLSHGGADTIYLSCKVDWHNFHLEKARPYIEWVQRVIKEEFRENDEPVPDYFTPTLDDNGHNFFIQGYGANPGDSKYSYYPYVLRELDIRYMFNRKEYNDEMPAGNCYIIIGSKPLMRWGEQTCYEIINHAIGTLGGKIKECTVSRIDLCVDLADVTVQPFVDAIYHKAFVCRARNQAFYQTDDLKIGTYAQHHKYTGVQVGRSNILCRIYDKLEETKNDEEKRMLLNDYRFGGKLPQTVTRVEFQLRRDALRSINVNGKCQEGIKTFADYQTCRADLLNYLCNSWLRFYDSSVANRNHSERLKKDDYLPEWKIAVNTFLGLEKTAEFIEVSKVKRNYTPECKRLKDGLAGYVTSLLATRSVKCDNERDLIREELKIIREINDGDGVKKMLKRKKEKQATFASRSTIKYV